MDDAEKKEKRMKNRWKMQRWEMQRWEMQRREKRGGKADTGEKRRKSRYRRWRRKKEEEDLIWMLQRRKMQRGYEAVKISVASGNLNKRYEVLCNSEVLQTTHASL